jgi:hypothetical protein
MKEPQRLWFSWPYRSMHRSSEQHQETQQYQATNGGFRRNNSQEPHANHAVDP